MATGDDLALLPIDARHAARRPLPYTFGGRGYGDAGRVWGSTGEGFLYDRSVGDPDGVLVDFGDGGPPVVVATLDDARAEASRRQAGTVPEPGPLTVEGDGSRSLRAPSAGTGLGLPNLWALVLLVLLALYVLLNLNGG